MSLAGLTDLLMVWQEQEEYRQRTGLAACLCVDCGGWAELGSRLCEWCLIVRRGGKQLTGNTGTR